MNHLKLLAAILGMALSSCTIVDTGGAVDNIGRKIPVADSMVRYPAKHRSNKTGYTVYTEGDTAYIAIRVRYQPARAKWFRCYQIGGCPVEAYPRFYNAPFGGGSLNDGDYFAMLPADKLTAPNMPNYIQQFIPKKQLKTVPKNRIHIELAISPQCIVQRFLKDERNTANTFVQPLRWVADVADIPLSCIATPTNWILWAFGYDLWSL